MTSSWLLLGFRSVVKNPYFISSHNGVQKFISFLYVAILGTQRAHIFLYPNFSVTASWIVVLDTSGMMWCNSLHLAFGQTLDWRCHFKHVSLTKPVVPLSNEHGSRVKDQGRRQCCHNKHKKFPCRPTHDVLLLSGHASYFDEMWSDIYCVWKSMYVALWIIFCDNFWINGSIFMEVSMTILSLQIIPSL
jgi:hypothetical protein